MQKNLDYLWGIYRFLKNISFSGIVNTMKIDLSIFMSCKAGFLLTISLFCPQEVIITILGSMYDSKKKLGSISTADN